jgi:hypothetical protein
MDRHHCGRIADHPADGLLRPQPPAGRHGGRTGSRARRRSRRQGLRAGQPRRSPRLRRHRARMLDRYTPAQLIGFARRLDPGLTAHDFADAGRQLDHIADQEFSRYGLSHHDVAALRAKFAAWPRTPQAVSREAAASSTGIPMRRRNADPRRRGRIRSPASNTLNITGTGSACSDTSSCRSPCTVRDRARRDDSYRGWRVTCCVVLWAQGWATCTAAGLRTARATRRCNPVFHVAMCAVQRAEGRRA